MKKNYFLKVLLITLIGLGTNVYGQTTWTGAEGVSWNNEDNWSNGIPDFANPGDVTIPDVTNDPEISGTQASVNGSMTINSGAKITLTNGATLQQIGGNLVNNGSIILNDGTEYKNTGATVSGSGNFKYNRTLSTTNWYLVSSPFEGQGIDNFIAVENPATANSDIAVAPYNTLDDTWTYVQTGSSGNGVFNTGEGYSVKLQSSGDISFTGSLLTTDKTITLDNSGNRYNLVGNPYPVHYNASAALANSSSSLHNGTETFWVWDQSANSGNGAYEAKNAASSFEVAPAQGFFIRSAVAGGSFIFRESDQAFENSDSFLRPDARPEIGLTLSNSSASREATIYYIDGTTTGFDNAYDGPRFMAGDNSFAFYTHLVSDSEGVDYQIQSLPPDNYENMVIPVGINAVSGTTISIEASTVDFPEGMNIYLEDKEDDSFTLLDGDTNFTTTLASDLNGIGRFYLHTTTGSLSADDLSTNNNISIYNSSRENLRIVGVQNGTAKVQLYNILGKEVFSNTFEGAGVNDIQLTSLAEGLYIVNLSTANGKTNKKIIIK